MKRYFRLILASISLFCTCIGYGQNKNNERIDSLLRVLASDQYQNKEDTDKINLLDAVTDAFGEDFPDESIMYDKEEIALSEKLHWPKGVADGYRHLGDDYGTKKNYIGANEVFYKSLHIYDSLKDSRNSGITLIKIDLSYRGQNKYDSGLIFATKAAVVFEGTKDSAYLATAYANMGVICFGKNDFAKSLAYSFKSLEIAEYIKNDKLTSEIHGFIGMVYLGLAKDTTAPGHKAEQQQNLLKAIDFLQKGIAECIKIKDDDDDNPLNDAKEYCNSLSEAYALAGNYPKAYETSLQASALNDSIQSTEHRQENETREKIFQINKKELQKDILEIKLKKSEELLFIIVIILLLVVISLIIWNFIAQSRKQHLQGMLMEYKIRNDIATDLHDHIGSSLSSIILMSNLAQQQPSYTADYLVQISDTSNKIVDNMNDIVWAINPDNDRMEQILARMQEFAASLLEKKNITVKFEAAKHIDSVKLNMEERKNFYLTFKEIIHNAFKHSGCSVVSIWLGTQNESNSITMKVTDNGKGFDTAQKYTGNGLYNLQKRVSELNGKMEITSAPGNGTTIQVNFKPTQTGS